MTDERRVLIIAKSLDGGTGTFLEYFLQLKNRFSGKYQIEIIALDEPKFRTATRFSVPLSIMRATSRESDVYRISPLTIITMIKELHWIFREANRIHPHIILTIDTHCAFLGCIYKLFHPTVRLVLTIHNNIRAVMQYKLTGWGRFIFMLICQKLFCLADAVIGVSHGVSDDLEHVFALKKPVKTIYNGMPICTGKHVPVRTLPVHLRYPVLISTGRLALQKDVNTLICAISIVKKTFPFVKLFLIGDGPDRTRLEQLVRQFHLEGKILFEGWQSSLDAYYAHVDLFILSSHFEGFSYALLEAMKKGIPVISTDSPYGPSEILDKGKAGILVKPSDPDNMANAIISLVKSPIRYQKFSRLAFKRSRYFSEEKMLKNYDALFDSL